MRPSFSTYFLLAAVPLMSAAGDEGAKEIGRTTEREVSVVLSSGFGNIAISKGESQKILTIEGGTRSADASKVNVEYAIRNRVGYAEISLGDVKDEGNHKKRVFNLGSWKGESWTLRFSDAVPISFDIELGVGKARLDLSGLQVKDLNVSSGATEVDLIFNELNTSAIENVNIESAVSTFTGRKLGNANFKRFRFQGGVGACTLDFSGQLQKEVDVEIEVGLGLVTVVVPNEIGAKVSYERNWISRVDCDPVFSDDGEGQCITDNYSRAAGRMNIRVQTGLGSVKIRR